MESIRVDLEAGQFNDVLRETTRLLNIRVMPRDFDRVELMQMRSESLLRLRKFKLAQDAFEEIGELPTTSKEDVTRRCLARSTAWLIEKSSPRGYVFRGEKSRQVVDILEPISRKKAMELLLVDESESTISAVDRAISGQQLSPILAQVSALSRFSQLEVAVTGTDAKSRTARDRLYDRAVRLIDQSAIRMGSDVQRIEDRANDLVERRRERRLPAQVVLEIYYVRRGLDSRGSDELKEIQATCRKIAEVVKRVTEESADAGAMFEGVKNPVQDVYDDAERVLKADYTGEVDRRG